MLRTLEISCLGDENNDFADAVSLTHATQSSSLTSQLGTNGGAFFVSNDRTVNALTSVVSSANKVHGCYTSATGGAWTLKSVDFTDQNSEYSYTTAVKGGVFYAENSALDVSDVTFTKPTKLSRAEWLT